MIGITSKTYMISRDYKNLSYIIYFNFGMKNYYVSTYTKSKKDSNISNN